MKSAEGKKIYSKPRNGVFMACQLALMRMKCSIIESGDYFSARIGFSSHLFGYIIRLDLVECSDGQTEVTANSKAGSLLLFSNPREIVNKIFKKIDRLLIEKEK
jgi:hypothetical protein